MRRRGQPFQLTPPRPMLSRQIDYWHEAKGLPASLQGQLQRLRVWRNAAEHRDAQRWRREGPKSDAEFSELLERIRTELGKVGIEG